MIRRRASFCFASVLASASRLPAAAFLPVVGFAAACLFGGGQSLAQNAYITNSGSNSVSVIAAATNTVSATIAVGVLPLGVAVSPDGSTVYVANAGSNTVSVIAAAS